MRCACQRDGPQPELLIRLLQDHYYIARMPETGHLHARLCPMFSEDASLSGVAEYAGALHYRGELAEVKLGFALHAAMAPAAARAAPAIYRSTITRLASANYDVLISPTLD